MQTIFIDTEYANIHAMSAGQQGDPLVLGIHGWSKRNGWQTWEPMLQPLAEAGFWAVSVDMPGWGQSLPKIPEAMMNGSAVQVVLQILDALAVDTAVLMGKSWGGGVALETAVQFPERVSKLILTAPARQNLDPLRQLKQPVLLAWAEDDPVIPFQVAQSYMARIPEIQLESYPAGGHSAAQKNVADFAPKAIKFLKS